MSKLFKTMTKSTVYAFALALMMPMISLNLQATDIHNTDFSQARAGVIMLKQYGPGDWAILLGEKAGTTQEWKSVNFPAGKYDKNDAHDLRITACRELIEETGGKYSPLKNLSPDHLSSNYIEYNSTRLYFLDVTYMNEVGKRSLHDAVKAANSDHLLPSCYKEIGDYWAVPVQNIVKVAKRVAGSKNTADKRQFYSRGADGAGNSEKLQLESYYTNVIAHNKDKMCEILLMMTGGMDYSKS